MNKIMPYLVPVILFFVITFAYMSPVLEGKKLLSHDVSNFKGMVKELQDFKEETGEQSLWTNSMFGGMPAYLISASFPGNIMAKIQKATNVIPQPVRYMLLHFTFFYILCLVLGVSPWVGFAGALAYGFFSFFFILLQVGHMTKVHTLAYMSLVVAGVIVAYRKKPVAGSLLAAVGLSWMLSANHPQMTYYAGIMVAIIVATYFIFAIKEKLLSPFIKVSALLVIAVILAVGSNFSRLYTTIEYGKYSIRGKSELTQNDEDKTSGLDKSYILSYSYDWGEAMTAFIPRFKGGGMAEPMGESSEVYKLIEKSNGKASAKRIAENLPLYWGSQPISNAPFYYGAVFIFLFVFGLFNVKGREKWWIAAVVFISFLMSLGKNFPLLSNFLIDYLPGYNKFRDVKNIIVIQQFAMAVLGVLAVKNLLSSELDKKLTLKNLKYSFYITGGIALIFALMPGLAGNFQGATDARLQSAGWPAELIDALVSDRKMVLRADAIRSLIFVALSAGLIWLFIAKKIKAQYALILWVVLIFADMWPIDKKYLNNDNFTSTQKVENPFTPSNANQEILKDTDPDYRVLNLAGDAFSDPMTSYFHKSIGGYHGAKMKRYQETIEHRIFPEMQMIGQRLQKLSSESSLDSVFMGLNVLNMLNTRYVIYNPNAAPLVNSHALGNAWFVNDVLWVENADEEIDELGKVDPAKTAIIDKRFDSIVDGSKLYAGEGSSIQLESYQPNYLVYQAKVTGNEALAVFSEIYYPKGWDAFIDGQKVEHACANYILRALPIPQGTHKVEFKFEPQSYAVGNKVSLASSLILLLVALAVAYIEIKGKTQIKDEEEATGKA